MAIGAKKQKRVSTGCGWSIFFGPSSCDRCSLLFYIVICCKRAHTLRMTTDTRQRRLFGWSVRCVGIVLALAFCATAFADPSKNVVTLEKQQPVRKTVKKVCYTMISGSAIPQPCSRLR